MRYGLADIRNYDSVESSRNLAYFEPLYEPGRSRTSRRTVTWSGVTRAMAQLRRANVAAVVGPTPPPEGLFPRVDHVGAVWIGRLDGVPLLDCDSDHGTVRFRLPAEHSGPISRDDNKLTGPLLVFRSWDWGVPRVPSAEPESGGRGQIHTGSADGTRGTRKRPSTQVGSSLVATVSISTGISYDPGWRATAGHASAVVRPDATGTFLEVAAAPGMRLVELVYDPPEVRVALGITLLSLGMIGALGRDRSARVPGEKRLSGLGRSGRVALESNL